MLNSFSFDISVRFPFELYLRASGTGLPSIVLRARLIPIDVPYEGMCTSRCGPDLSASWYTTAKSDGPGELSQDFFGFSRWLMLVASFMVLI